MLLLFFHSFFSLLFPLLHFFFNLFGSPSFSLFFSRSFFFLSHTLFFAISFLFLLSPPPPPPLLFCHIFRPLGWNGWATATSMPKYWPVVRAALSAGLYPNLVRVDYGKKKFKASIFGNDHILKWEENPPLLLKKNTEVPRSIKRHTMRKKNIGNQFFFSKKNCCVSWAYRLGTQHNCSCSGNGGGTSGVVACRLWFVWCKLQVL